MIDTHTHIYLPEFEEGGEEVARRAREAGVGHFVFPNIDWESVEPMLRLHEALHGESSVAMGLHPTEVDADWKSELREIERLMRDVEICAIGEVGLDLHWDSTYYKEQKEAFEWQLAIARERGLTLIIHCRDAMPQMLESIDTFRGELPQLLFHSFTGDAQEAADILGRGDALFGINGVATFRNASSLRDAIKSIGVEKIVFETDSPYLAPVPYRGRRNESAYIMETLKSVSETLAIPPDEVERITDETASQIFRL